MPRRKALTDYPKEYFRIVEDAQEQPVKVPCENYERARLLRNSWYLFRSALIEEAESNDAYARLATLSRRITINLNDNINDTSLLFTYYDPEHDEIAEAVVRRRLEK